MTLTVEDFVVTTGGSGVTVFVYNKPYDALADLRMMIVDAAGVERIPTWTATGSEPGTGASLTVTSEPGGVPNTDQVVMWRVTRLQQLTDYDGGDFPSATHGRFADRTIMALQEAADNSGRALRVAFLSPPIHPFNPTPNAVLMFGDDGQPVAGPSATEVAAAQGHAIAASGFADAAAASAAVAEAVENTILKPKGQWLTATGYVLGDLTYQLGSQYECIVAHTSGTFATDLADGQWRVFVAQGAPGPGAGDVVAANSGSEYIPNAEQFRANLVLPVSPILKITGVDILTRNYNARGEFNNIGAACANMPPGGADGDHIFVKKFDNNNLVIQWFRADGTIVVNKRNAGTWTGWIEQATQGYVATAIAAAQRLLHVQDRKTLGTSGGTFTAGSYVARALNSVRTNSIPGATLTSNQITLPAGTYEIEAECPAYAVNRHKALLYNVTDAAVQVLGTAAFAYATGFANNHSLVRGRFTIAGIKVFEIRHSCEATQVTLGFGVQSSMTYEEIYTDVRIRKIA